MMKKLLCCLMAALVLFGTVGCAASVAPVTPDDATQAPAATTTAPDSATQAPDAATQAPADVIAFDDAALETYVRAAMNKLDGDITVADAQAVTELELSQQGVDPKQPYIHNLSALQYFTNLTYLGLGYAVQDADDPKAPVDISALAGLTKLESLQMGGVVVSDLSALSNMKSLISLSIFNGEQALDLTPLAGLTSLQALTLRNNEITDITPLKGLTNLTYLDLEGNQITDVTPLVGLTKMNRLFLSNNPITDFKPLADIRAKLEEWDFQVNP